MLLAAEEMLPTTNPAVVIAELAAACVCPTTFGTPTIATKFAVIVIDVVIVTVVVGLFGFATGPVHPVNVNPGLGLAVIVTVVPVQRSASSATELSALRHGHTSTLRRRGLHHQRIKRGVVKRVGHRLSRHRGLPLGIHARPIAGEDEIHARISRVESSERIQLKLGSNLKRARARAGDCADRKLARIPAESQRGHSQFEDQAAT